MQLFTEFEKVQEILCPRNPGVLPRTVRQGTTSGQNCTTAGLPLPGLVSRDRLTGVAETNPSPNLIVLREEAAAYTNWSKRVSSVPAGAYYHNILTKHPGRSLNGSQNGFRFFEAREKMLG